MFRLYVFSIFYMQAIPKSNPETSTRKTSNIAISSSGTFRVAEDSSNLACTLLTCNPDIENHG